MSSGVRPAETLDADQQSGHAPVAATDAEKEAAEAQARAVAARARATQLRRQAEAAGGQSSTTDTADAQDLPATDGVAEAEPLKPTPSRPSRRWLRRPGATALAVSTAVLVTVVSLIATGYLLRQHRAGIQNHERAAEFAAAARRDVVMLMSIDADKAQEDIQRIIDNSTGKFKDYLEGNSNGLVGELRQAKVSTKITVGAVAVESMTDDSAVVLVAATSDITGADNAKQGPRPWRVSLTLNRDGGQLKMSKVEFI